MHSHETLADAAIARATDRAQVLAEAHIASTLALVYPQPASRDFVNGSEPALIEFREVDVAFGDHLVLGKLSLEVRRGEIVCVVGPSGCGKTTALRVASGLIRADSRRGRLRRRANQRPAPRCRGRLPGLFESAPALAHRRGQRLRWRSKPRERRALSVRTASPSCSRASGLGAFAQKYPSQMSGGMQQRLQIARCLAQEPSALMMDEPFGALDAMTRQTLQDQMLDIARATSATIFFVTHDLEEAIYLGDRVIGLMSHPGRVGLDVAIDLPRPRNQVSTRESPEFLELRRTLYDFIHASETAARS